MNLLQWGTWRALWSTRRSLLIATAVVCLSAGALDFILRVWVSRDSTLRVFTVPKLPPTPSTTAADAIQKQFATWMPVPAPPPPPPPELRLQGVLGSGSQIRASLVLVEGSGAISASFLVSKGEAVQDWVVQRIDRKGVQLKRGTETKDLILFPLPVE